MFSLFKYKYFESKIRQKDYVSYYDWKKERQMNAVLLELSKVYPETRYLYNKYLDRSIGWIENKLNKHDIIYNYLKLIKLDYVKSIIDNFEINGQSIRDKHDICTIKDKNILLYILNNYLMNTTNKNIYDELIDIINSIKTNKIESDSYTICNILYDKSISKYHPTIINNIIHYRKLEQDAMKNNYII